MTRKSSLPDALTSAATKLKRANLHSHTAEREIKRFFKRHPEPTFRVHGPSQVAVGEIFDVWNVVDEGYPEPPDSFAARLGDAIHNYRSALDHIAWQLVKHGKVPDPERPNAVQFPYYDTEAGFDSNRARRLPGVDDVPVEFIKSRQATPRWGHSDNPLRVLVHFSNDDKHRTLKVVVAALRSGEVHHYGEVGCEVIAGLVPNERPSFKSGTPVAGFRCRCTAPDPKVSMKSTLTGAIAIEDSGELLHVLELVRAEVTLILWAPEIHQGITASP